MYFDGQSGKVDVPVDISTAWFPNASNWTLEFWAKFVDFDSVYPIFGSHYNELGLGRDIISVYTETDGSIKFRIAREGGDLAEIVSATNHANVDTWTHYCITGDERQNLCFYIRTELVDQTTYSDSSHPRGRLEEQAFIGACLKTGGSGDTPNWTHGHGKVYMDGFRVWNFCKSQSEVQGGKKTLILGGEAGLVAAYDFSSGSGNTLYDLSANGYNGALSSSGAIWIQE
jgi:hypothetical protein